MQAQPGHNIVKPPKVNIPRVINIPKVKIHANSNSVYGNGNSHPDYNKKSQPKKEEIKNEEEGKKDKPRKQKK